MKEVKSYLCADMYAQSYNEQIYKKEIEGLDNPYIKFLYNYQHPFFKILMGEEVNNNGGKDPFFIFTFLHNKDKHNILLNLVVESKDIDKATIVFSTRFRGNRFQYNEMIKSVMEYFTDKTFNKRSRLMEYKLIGSDKPMFSLNFSRIYHIKETWFSSVTERIFLNWSNTFGILRDLMVDNQKLGKEYLDGTEI